ncbi:MAG: PepSY domain-containing protein [Actinophytocola sp.]|uniref:PepSY domain-containing protein n=1 Tax=Actinophytocola sp. TaxID=1872138 RepID=UPI003C71E0EE
MTRKLLVGAIVAGALAVTAGTAFALSSGDQPSPDATSAPPPTSSSSSTPTSSSTSETTPTSSSAAPAPGGMSANDAARVVQERMGGTVHEVEREVEHGRLEWKVEITARDGITYDVRVDAATGDVTRVEQDDNRDDDGDDDSDDDSDSGRHGGDDHGGDRHGGDRDDD